MYEEEEVIRVVEEVHEEIVEVFSPSPFVQSELQPPPHPSRRGAKRVGEIRRKCQKPEFWVQH